MRSQFEALSNLAPGFPVKCRQTLTTFEIFSNNQK